MAKQASDQSGVAFFGCAIVGLGFGLLFDNPGVGVVLGAGVGFLVMAVLRSRK